MPGSRRRWVVRGRGDGSAAWFRAEIAARTGRIPEIAEGARPVAFLAAQHRARTVVRGRVALLGDAAHEISPIGGQGMNLGWVDAGRLATALLWAVQGDRDDLREYARQTPRSARAAQRRSAFYMAMGSPAQGMPLLAREALIRTLGTPPLRAWSTGLITMRGL